MTDPSETPNTPDLEQVPVPVPILVRSGRNPHAICMAVGLMLISLYGLVAGPASTSLDAGMTLDQRIAYGALSIAGSSTTLAGLYWRHMIAGLLIERAGQCMWAAGSATFVIVLCKVSTFDRSGLVTIIAIAIAAGSIWRVKQITADLRKWREANRRRVS